MKWTGSAGQAKSPSQDGEHGSTVTDQGRGFADSPEELAVRFSIAKAMVSSKQWRKPTRGCVGNGLRVIVGAVVDGGGHIVVKTRNQQGPLRPRMDGTAAVEDVCSIDWPAGTAITVEIDPAYRANGDPMRWAQLAIELARSSGPPSPDSHRPAGSTRTISRSTCSRHCHPIRRWLGSSARWTGVPTVHLGRPLPSDSARGVCVGMSASRRRRNCLRCCKTWDKAIKPKQLGAMGREA